MDKRIQHTISREMDSSLASQTGQQQPLGEVFPDLAPGLVMSTFRASQLWGGMAWRRAFPGQADQAAPARRMVGQLLADSGRTDDARWVAAELVSNALRHTRSGQARGFFVVEVLRGAAVARVVVYDLGGGSVPDFSRTSDSASDTAEHGRGLLGVAELAIRVGVAGDAVTGHAVWADLALISESACAARRADEVRQSSAINAFDRAGQALDPLLAAPSYLSIHAEVCRDCASVGERAVGEAPRHRSVGLPHVLMASKNRPGWAGGEVVGLDPRSDLWEAS
ncbi:ATP-binding protein [Nonomuraea bangladeshensis]|uniref:ATP-binding protein n=1 Tax=Nonomuraea bangladeshensis TaxID=404385 RepID=UPI0031DE0D9D